MKRAGMMRRLRDQTVRLRNPDDRESGVTLVELMITTLVTALVAAMTAALVIGVQQSNHQNVTRQDQIDTARVSVETMSRTLRASIKPSQIMAELCTVGCTEDAFLQGSAFTVQFYTNIDNPQNTIGPSRVTYTVATTGTDAGDLVETVQIPNSPIPTATGYAYCTPGSSGCASKVSTRTLARGVVTSQPVFNFYDGEGTKMTLPSSGNLEPDQLKHLLSMELALTVQIDTGEKAGPTTYIQRLMMPNAQAVMKGGTT